jgi:hypothetical protein
MFYGHFATFILSGLLEADRQPDYGLAILNTIFV